MHDGAWLPVVSTHNYINNISDTEIGNRCGDSQTTLNEIAQDGQLHQIWSQQIIASNEGL